MNPAEDIQVVIACLSLIGVLVGVALTFLAKRKVDEANTKLAERRDTVADRDALIDRMERDLARHAEDIRELRAFAMREPFYVSYVLALQAHIEAGYPPPPPSWPEVIDPALRTPK